jgi:hypothetical protein
VAPPLLLDPLALVLPLEAPPPELDALPLDTLLPAGLVPPAPPPLPELTDPVVPGPPAPPAPPELPLEELDFSPESQPAAPANAIDNPAISATLRPLTKGHLRNNCKSGSHYMGTPRT